MGRWEWAATWWRCPSGPRSVRPNPQWRPGSAPGNSIPEPTAEQKDQNPQDSPARINPTGDGRLGRRHTGLGSCHLIHTRSAGKRIRGKMGICRHPAPTIPKAHQLFPPRRSLSLPFGPLVQQQLAVTLTKAVQLRDLKAGCVRPNCVAASAGSAVRRPRSGNRFGTSTGGRNVGAFGGEPGQHAAQASPPWPLEKPLRACRCWKLPRGNPPRPARRSVRPAKPVKTPPPRTSGASPLPLARQKPVPGR